MTKLREQLDRFMVDTFHHVLRAEERLLRRAGYQDLSISEMHVIEAIERAVHQEQHNARGIAAALDITPGSLTAAINVLEKKGYVLRQRGPGDRRHVYIHLTQKGGAAADTHRRVHQQLVDGVLAELSPQEAQVFARALERVARFFTKEDTA